MDQLHRRLARLALAEVGAILRSGRYTGDELLALAKEHDPGFDEDELRSRS